MVERKMSATPAEWEVLEVLFRRAPLSAREVYDALAGARGSYRTVRTLLERLLGKGVLKRSDSHGIWVFEPAAARGGDSAARRGAASCSASFPDGQSSARLISSKTETFRAKNSNACARCWSAS